ncbi:hypothetical protein CKO20_13015 [Rhodocyclus tenuis]|nr:hypothetical protein [Rhodocyclus tenuis]
MRSAPPGLTVLSQVASTASSRNGRDRGFILAPCRSPAARSAGAQQRGDFRHGIAPARRVKLLPMNRARIPA